VKQNKLPNTPESLEGVELVGAPTGEGINALPGVAGSAGSSLLQLNAIRNIATSRNNFRAACIVESKCSVIFVEVSFDYLWCSNRSRSARMAENGYLHGRRTIIRKSSRSGSKREHERQEQKMKNEDENENENENRKQKTKNEKWSMKNEKWKMKDEWWKMETENGKWKMENGNWKLKIENDPALPRSASSSAFNSGGSNSVICGDRR
jgi:hypothetical protein